ncbi:MAG TPA: hypothetical protein ENI82_05940, partial [Bacteroidetes bacterium]|nr:hypothetical protein [Bacteroidota bacterium]
MIRQILFLFLYLSMNNFVFSSNTVFCPNDTIYSLIKNPGFETGNTNDWSDFGTSTISASSVEKHIGNYSCLIEDRAHNYSGVAQSIKDSVQQNVFYEFTAWAKVKTPTIPLEDVGYFKIALKLVPVSGSNEYPLVGQVKVYKTGWIKIRGYYRFQSPISDYNDIFVDIQGPDPSVDFYVDDISINPPLDYTPPASDSTDFIRVSGRDLIVGADNSTIKLQGINFWAYSDDLTDDPMDFVFNSYRFDWCDYANVDSLGFNCVRLNMDFRAFEDDNDPYVYKQEGWEWLERNIIYARNNGIYLLLDMHTPQGGYQSYGFTGEFWGNSNEAIENRNRLKALWAEIATRYNSEPTIAGFDLINEPLPPTSGDYYDYIQEVVDTIRSIDTNHIIDIEQAFSSSNGEFPHQLVSGGNIIYDTHFYHRWSYTSQLIPSNGGNDGGNYPEDGTGFNKNDLKAVLLDGGLQFSIDNNVPHNEGEFGVSRYVFPITEKGGIKWMTDVYDLHNRNKINSQYWSYHSSGWGLYYNEFGFPDIDSTNMNLDSFFHNTNTTDFPPYPDPETFYLDSAGSDTASGLDTANAWATFVHAFGIMQEGDTLKLKDGTYFQTMEVKILGTSEKAIIIKALNEGKAIIDGEGIREPGVIGSDGENYDSYITIEGLIFKNANSGDGESVFRVWNNYNTLKKCSFYFADNGTNQNGLSFSNSKYNLAEDCLASYVSAHCFISWDDAGLETHNTFRRCFATGHHPDKSDSLAYSGFNIYGGSYDIVENCIGWYGTKNYGVSLHSESGANYKCNNNKVLGSLMLGAGKVSNSIWYEGVGISIDYNGGQSTKDNEVENCMVYDNQMHGFNIGEQGNTENTLIDHCTMEKNGTNAIRCKDPLTTTKNS